MDRRDGAEELLDGPLDDQPALVGNLRDLRRLNRLSGGVALSRWRRQPAARRDRRAVDADRRRDRRRRHPGGAPRRFRVAWTGPRGHGRRQPGRGAQRRRALPARSWIASSACGWPSSTPERLPYQNETFDVGHASLVVHHLDEDAAVRFLAELGRVSRRGIVVNDLHRGRLGLLGAWLAGRFLTRNRYTRHDAPLSVRRAYTLAGGRGAAAPGRARAGRSAHVARSGSATRSIAVPAAAAVRRGRGPVTGPDVAIVGGGPAGAIVASLLARAGFDVTVFERSPAYRWRACGVFASPATVAALRRLGLGEATLARVARPIPAMRVETPAGIAFRLPYGDGGAGRVRPLGARSGAPRRGANGRRDGVHGRPGRGGGPRRAAAGAPCPHGRMAWCGTRPGSSSGPTAATRSSPGQRAWPDPPGLRRASASPSTSRTVPAIPSPTPGCACSATDTSVSPRFPADG